MPALPPDVQVHPGLLLDKWHALWPAQGEDKTFVRDQLRRVISGGGDQALLARVRDRFEAATSTGCRRWTRRASGPLTLHLSRAGSFENAGICLHPIYGFAYLPGTGIKGMARCYARNMAGATADEIEAVFGKDTTKEARGAAGAVVFYDALPVQWPKLIIDIVNNHHRRYYEGDNDHTPPPGDWEEPVPVNFLAIASGTEFEFCLGVRRGVTASERLLALAKDWIDGALAWLGTGAKTNAGYGRFTTGVALNAECCDAVFTSTLTLTTPAFLAGSLQESDDCTLRPATLRGLLRWWWRTMHAGHITAAQLLKLERSIWGGTAGPAGEDAPSAISISLEPIGSASPIQYRKQDVANAHGLKKPDRPKATQGIAYITYGMDEKTRCRYYLPDGSQWKLTIVAGPAPPLSTQQVLDQAKAALWLLTSLGGTGSKARKGFGCIVADTGVGGLQECMQRAAEVRTAARLTNRASEFLRQSPSLENMLGPADVNLPTTDVWHALDQVGDAIQEFAQAHKHRVEKKALGLPRRMRESDPEMQQLSRHASPVHFHLQKDAFGFKATVAAFPSAKLRSFEKNREFLQKFVDHFRGKQFKSGPLVSRTAAPTTTSSAPRPSAAPLKIGAIVAGVLLEEKTRKGGWKARETGSGLAGPIQNAQAVPAGVKAGDTVKLKVKIVSAKDAAFEYVP
jgi:CRISPR-associated protein Cmr6